MNLGKIDRYIQVITLLLFVIAMYHLARYYNFQVQLMERFYHIAHNGIIVASLHYIRSLIKPQFKMYRRLVLTLSIYPSYKILLVSLFMFKWFRLWQEKFNRDLWSISLFLIIIILIAIITRIK